MSGESRPVKPLTRVDWDAVQEQIVASIRADLLIGTYTPGFDPFGDYFVNGVKDSVAQGIKAYRDKSSEGLG